MTPSAAATAKLADGTARDCESTKPRSRSTPPAPSANPVPVLPAASADTTSRFCPAALVMIEADTPVGVAPEFSALILSRTPSSVSVGTTLTDWPATANAPVSPSATDESGTTEPLTFSERASATTSTRYDPGTAEAFADVESNARLVWALADAVALKFANELPRRSASLAVCSFVTRPDIVVQAADCACAAVMRFWYGVTVCAVSAAAS